MFALTALAFAVRDLLPGESGTAHVLEVGKGQFFFVFLVVVHFEFLVLIGLRSPAASDHGSALYPLSVVASSLTPSQTG